MTGENCKVIHYIRLHARVYNHPYEKRAYICMIAPSDTNERDFATSGDHELIRAIVSLGT